MSAAVTAIAVLAVGLFVFIIGMMNVYSFYEEFASDWFPSDYATFTALVVQLLFCGATVFLWELIQYAGAT